MDTYKLIFSPETTLIDVETIVKKYTKKFKIHNFQENTSIGCNRLSYAVVDLEDEVMRKIVSENPVTIDGMNSAQTRSKGGCCETTL